MRELARFMVTALRSPGDETLVKRIAGDVQALCRRYPVPGIAIHQ
jgi:glycine/serine hydroxymethyltransferase